MSDSPILRHREVVPIFAPADAAALIRPAAQYPSERGVVRVVTEVRR